MANSLTTSSGAMLKIGMSVDSAQAKAEFNKTMKILQQDSQIRLTIDGTDFTKTIKTYQDSMKNLVQTTTLWNHSTSQSTTEVTGLTSAMERVNNTIATQTNQIRNLSNAQNNLNAHTAKSVSVFQDFTNTFLKMAKFNTINLIYDGIINNMTKAIEVTEKFNAATIEFQKVSELSGESLSKYTQYLGELGSEVARTTSEMISGATEWKKSGFSEEESAQLAKLTAQFQNIADEELEASKAASILISVMKGFRLSTQDVEHIEDSINSVSNSFAVSSSDISQGLGNVAAVSHTAGNSLEETIGMLTAMVEISRNASKSSRGLIQITTRLSQTLDDTSATGKKLRNIYEELGISLEDSRGQLRSSYDILKDLSKVWNNLSTDQQKYIALTSSGANQINNFTALMSNFGTAIEATETALNSAGSAAEENAKYMEGIAAQLTSIQAQVERLILGDGGLENFVVVTLKLANGLLTLINSLGGLQSIFTLIGTVGIIAVIQNFEKIITLSKTLGTTLITPFKTLGTYISTTFNNYMLTATNSMFAMVNAETAAAASTAMLKLALSAVVTILGVATIAYKKYKQAQEEAQQNAVNASENYKTEQKNLTETISRLNDESATRSQLASIIKQQLGDAYDSEIDSLKNVNDLRQKGIELIYAEARAKAEEIQRTTGAQYTESKGYLSQQGVTNRGNGEEAVSITGTPEERYKAIGQKLDEYNNKIKQNIQLSYDEQYTQKVLEEEYGKLGEEIEQNKTIVETYDESTKLLNGTFESYMESLVNTAKETEDFQEVLDKFGYETLEDLEEALINAGGSEDEFNNALLSGKDALSEYADSLLQGQNNSKEMEGIFGNLFSSVEDLQSAYETLTKAADEYNKNGVITASTLKKLNKLEPEYLASLYKEGDMYTNISNDLNTYLDKEKADAKIKVEIARVTALLEIAQNKLNGETDKSKTAIDNFATAASGASDDVAKLKNLTAQLAINMGAIRNQGKVDEDLVSQLQDANAFFDGLSESIDKVNLGAVESSKSAASSSKDAWKEAFEEEQRLLKHSLEMNEITEIEYYEKLKDLNEKYFGEISGKHKKYLKEYQENEEEIYKGLKSIYEKVADYLADAIEQGYEDAINALKKEEKRVLAEIKAQIEALKKEKKEVLDDITNQINDLKKQKDQVLDYWNSQIDKIKEANSSLQKQNELLEKQQALQQAKAQKVMVMKDGKFQLSENESAVAQAEQALSEYQDQMSYEQQIEEMEKLRDAQVQTLEDRIEALEEYKDYMEQYYDEQIEALEQYYDEVQRQYEEQIEALQEQLDAFKKGAEQQKKIEEARLAARALGINKESELFKISLENAQKYVEKYNEIMEALGNHSIPSADINFSTASFDGLPSDIGGIETSLKARASGDSNFANDEIALVGESPNAELVIGSHLNRSINSGKLVNLSKGSGVVNAESTSTLAGLLNGIVTPTNVSNSKATTQSFNFGSISLPNVTDADSFVNTLSHKFNNYAIQYSSNRR